MAVANGHDDHDDAAGPHFEATDALLNQTLKLLVHQHCAVRWVSTTASKLEVQTASDDAAADDADDDADQSIAP